MILIAESKTMASEQEEVSIEEFKEYRPLFDGIANAIMESLRGHSSEQLADEVGITSRLAVSLQRMIYEFPNKSSGIRAINAFTGVVFRQLGLDGYDDAQNRFLKDNIRIISSLYGWLRPDDIIKPYRFDFKSHEILEKGRDHRSCEGTSSEGRQRGYRLASGGRIQMCGLETCEAFRQGL